MSEGNKGTFRNIEVRHILLPNVYVFFLNVRQLKINLAQIWANWNIGFGEKKRPLGNIFTGVCGKGRQRVRTKKYCSPSWEALREFRWVVFFSPTSAPSAVHSSIQVRPSPGSTPQPPWGVWIEKGIREGGSGSHPAQSSAKPQQPPVIEHKTHNTQIRITTCRRISCSLVESRPPSMPIFLSLDEIFIFVFDFVNFCAQNMKYTMKCVSTVYSGTGMIWSWRVEWPDFKTSALC